MVVMIARQLHRRPPALRVPDKKLHLPRLFAAVGDFLAIGGPRRPTGPLLFKRRASEPPFLEIEHPERTGNALLNQRTPAIGGKADGPYPFIARHVFQYRSVAPDPRQPALDGIARAIKK